MAGCTSADAEAEPVAGCSDLRVDGRDRTYLLDPATGLAEGQKAAVVVVLHQEGGTPEGVAKETELASLKDQGATLVYPAGVDTSWDAGGCCGLPSRQGVDDVAFLDAVLVDVAKKTPVDTQAHRPGRLLQRRHADLPLRLREPRQAGRRRRRQRLAGEPLRRGRQRAATS